MWAVLWSAIVSALAAFAPRLLLMFGFVAFSETYTREFFNTLQQRAMGQINSLPAEFRTIVELTGLPDAISIVFSAYLAAVAISAAKAGMAKKGASFSNPSKGV